MYDSRCYDIAEAFLADEPTINKEEMVKKLAQFIQDNIENFISWEVEEERKRNAARDYSGTTGDGENYNSA